MSKPAAPRGIFPKTLEIDYAGKLKRRLRKAAERFGVELRKALALRADSEASDGDRIRRLMDRVRFEYESTYTQESTEKLAVDAHERVEGYVERQVTRQVKTVLGVDPLPFRKDRTLALDFVRENVSLIRSVEAEFFEKLADDILGAYSQGGRWEQLSKVIQERYSTSARRAELIARDQMGSLNAKLNQQKQQAAGATRYRWRNSQDQRVVGNPSGLYPEGNDAHGDHWSREGKVFSWNDPPHDGHPGEAINCRCTAEPIWDWDDEEVQEEVQEPQFPSAATMLARAGRAPRELPQDSPRRKWGTHVGLASNREFDHSQIGLPLERRTIEGISISREGVGTIERHLERLDHSNQNERMLDRLRRIERGEIELTEYDARFYTHELREFERYAAVGWESGAPADLDERHRLWNTQHTATLEEYGINPDVYPLYHPEAADE